MWYLSRTGQIEGPFNEAVIIDMIRSRLVDDGHICAVGAQEWLGLTSHAPFAEALRAREASVSAPPPPVAPEPVAAPAPPSLGHAPTAVGPGSFAPAAPAQQQQQASFAPVPTGPSFAPAPQQQASFAPAPQPQASFAPMPTGPSFAPNNMGQQPSMQPNMPSMGPQPSMHPSMPSFHGPSPSLAPHYMPPPQAAEGSKAGIIAAVIGVVVLVLGGGAAAAYFLFFRAPASLAAYYPENTEAYVEVVGVKRALLGLGKVEVFDASRIEDKKALTDAQNALARSFDLSDADAARLALSIGSVAVGGRGLGKSSQDSSAVAIVVSFDDKKAAENLLASSRFTLEGDVGKGAKRYSIKRRELTGEKADVSLVERGLSELRIDAKNKNDQLLWIPGKKLLVLADERGANAALEVIEAGGKSLKDSALYASQKARFEPGAVAGFVDSAVVAESPFAKELKKYLDGTGAIGLAAALEKPGIRLTLSGQVSGVDAATVARVDAASNVLSLPNKLPKETFAYVAFSSKTNLRGQAAKDELLKALQGKPGAEDAQKTLAAGEQALGIDVASIFDALGDEGVIATLAKDGYRYDPSQAMPSFDDVAVVYEQKLADVAAAKKIVTGLRGKASGLDGIKLDAAGDDLVLAGDGKLVPHAELRFKNDMLVLVVGGSSLADRTFAALGGASTLASDHAHTAAVEPLKAKHTLLWVDLGRVSDTALTALPQIKETASRAGLDLGLVHMTGEHRVTGAVAINLAATKDGKIAYTLDSMNLPMAGSLLAAVAPRHALKHAALGAPGGDATGSLTIIDSKNGSLTQKNGDALRLLNDGASAKTFGSSGLGLGKGEGGGLGRSGNLGDANAAKRTDGLGKGSSDATSASAGDDFPAICTQALDRYEHCVYAKVPASSRPGLVKSLRDSITKQQPKWRTTTCKSLLDAAERTNPGCH